MPLFSRPLRLGEVISFRYVSRTANDPRPMVMLFAENYEGKLHGINLRYTSPDYARQLYWFFSLPSEKSPMVLKTEQIEAQRMRMKEEFQKRKQEFLDKQVGVVVKPQTDSPFGTSTWGPTQKQTQPVTPEQLTPQKRRELTTENVQPSHVTPQQIEERRRLEYLNKISQMESYLGNPYVFYHNHIKTMFGSSKNISKVYRTYNPAFIRNLRIVRGLERLYR